MFKRARAGGTSYIDQGRGEAIVFIHGVGLNAEAWRPQIETFSRTHRVIAIDMLGHGESAMPTGEVTLESYVRQVVDVMDALHISSATIVGHSMGGLVAIGFALAHPARTLRLAVLNSVYRRSSDKRAAVLKRAEEIARLGPVGDIEEPLERWFGPQAQRDAIADDVRKWLLTANPQGYATAYQIFANSDEAFVGRLGNLAMSALFMTGDHDRNSTVEMAKAMAVEVQRGTAAIIDGARHMMNLTRRDEVNQALANHFKETAFDARDLRKAFGTFMTGVTVVTTRDQSGVMRGFTANSFSSVSLNPPLLLVCISKAVSSHDVFTSAKAFAVNILSEEQKEISGIFASKRTDKFSDVPSTESGLGNPLLSGSVAWFDCERHSVVNAGDHVILIGEVKAYAHTDANPLGYARGGYFTLGLEQSAVNAAARVGRAEVGAILEFAGKLVVFTAANGKFDLPHVGRGRESASTSQLIASLTARGIEAKLSFLFAVYENNHDHTQSIYYRGDAETAGDATLLDFDDLPWDRFRDDATRSMLRRYCDERLQGRYKIYSGDHISGDVRDVGDAA